MIVVALLILALFIAISAIFALLAIIATGGSIVTLEAGATVPVILILLGIIYAIVLIIAFLIFATYLTFLNPIIVLTKKRCWEAIKESFAIVKNRWWATFGRMLALQIASLILVYIIMQIFFLFEAPYLFTQTMVPPSITLVKNILQQIVVLPIGVAGIAWYLRIK